MKQRTIAVLGARGNTGRAIARALGEHTEHEVVLVGRDATKIQELAADLCVSSPKLGAVYRTMVAEAGEREALEVVIDACDVLVVAASVPRELPRIFEATVRRGKGYVDLWYSPRIRAEMRARAAAIRCLAPAVHEAGLHPGLAGILLREVSTDPRARELSSFSVMRADWSAYTFSNETLAELSEPAVLGVATKGGVEGRSGRVLDTLGVHVPCDPLLIGDAIDVIADLTSVESAGFFISRDHGVSVSPPHYALMVGEARDAEGRVVARVSCRANEGYALTALSVVVTVEDVLRAMDERVGGERLVTAARFADSRAFLARLASMGVEVVREGAS